MSKLRDPIGTGWWKDEIKTRGWEGMLLDRLGFHGSLRLSEVALHTSVSRPTALRHMKRLVKAGKAVMDKLTQFSDDPIVTKKR